MNVGTAERLAGGDVTLTAAIIELTALERHVLSAVAEVERHLGEVRRALAVGGSAAGFADSTRPITLLLLDLGQRDVLLARLADAGVDLAEVRRAARR